MSVDFALMNPWHCFFVALKCSFAHFFFNSDMSIPEDIDEQLSLSSFHSGKVRCFSSGLCFSSLPLDPDKRAAVSTTHLESAGKWFFFSLIISACGFATLCICINQSLLAQLIFFIYLET